MQTQLSFQPGNRKLFNQIHNNGFTVLETRLSIWVRQGNITKAVHGRLLSGVHYLVARMRCTIIKVDLSTYIRLH